MSRELNITYVSDGTQYPIVSFNLANNEAMIKKEARSVHDLLSPYIATMLHTLGHRTSSHSGGGSTFDTITEAMNTSYYSKEPQVQQPHASFNQPSFSSKKWDPQLSRPVPQMY